MAVDWMWLGAVTDDGITVSLNFTASTTADVRVSTDAAFGSTTGTHSSAATDATTGGNRAKIAVTGLDAATHYYVQATESGTPDTSFTGEFWTLPTQGTAATTTFVHSSCSHGIAGSSSIGAGVAATAADVAAVELWTDGGGIFCHLGDFHYADSTSSSTTTRAGYYDTQLNLSNFPALFREQPTVYTHDDHDFGANNSDGTSASNTAQNEAYRAVVPHYPLADSTYGVAQSFQVGRVYVIQTDLRSMRVPNSTADSSTKTMMGDATDSFDQKAWFKAELDAARDANCSAVVWLNSQVWCDDGTNNLSESGTGVDSWHNYATERTELADYLNAGGYPKVLILAGDMHASARRRDTDYSTAQDGVGSIDVFQCASMSRAPNYRGATWDSGPTQGDQQYGRLLVLDGADGLWVDWVVADEPNTTSATANHRIRYQIDAPAAASGVASDGINGLGRTYADGTSADALVALP